MGVFRERFGVFTKKCVRIFLKLLFKANSHRGTEQNDKVRTRFHPFNVTPVLRFPNTFPLAECWGKGRAGEAKGREWRKESDGIAPCIMGFFYFNAFETENS